MALDYSSSSLGASLGRNMFSFTVRACFPLMEDRTSLYTGVSVSAGTLLGRPLSPVCQYCEVGIKKKKARVER